MNQNQILIQKRRNPQIKREKTRRFRKEIFPQDIGVVKLETNVWTILEADQNKFIQRYNAKEKQKNLSELKIPKGITVKKQNSENI